MRKFVNFSPCREGRLRPVYYDIAVIEGVSSAGKIEKHYVFTKMVQNIEAEQ